MKKRKENYHEILFIYFYLYKKGQHIPHWIECGLDLDMKII